MKRGSPATLRDDVFASGSSGRVESGERRWEGIEFGAVAKALKAAISCHKNGSLAEIHTMKGFRFLLVGTAAVTVLSACTRQEAPTVTAIVSQEGGTGRCHINYQGVDRGIPCSAIAKVMRSEMQIPTNARIVVAPDKVASVDEVDYLAHALYNSGYVFIEFPSHSLPEEGRSIGVK